MPVSSLHGSKASVLVVWLPPLPILSGRILFCPLPCPPGFPRDGFLAHRRLSLKPHSTVIQREQHFLQSVSPQFLSGSQRMWSGQCPYLVPGPVTPPGLSSLYLFSVTLVPIHTTLRKFLLYFQQPEASLSGRAGVNSKSSVFLNGVKMGKPISKLQFQRTYDEFFFQWNAFFLFFLIFNLAPDLRLNRSRNNQSPFSFF